MQREIAQRENRQTSSPLEDAVAAACVTREFLPTKQGETREAVDFVDIVDVVDTNGCA